jgi:biotin synthase
MRNILQEREKLLGASREAALGLLHTPLDDLLSRADGLRRRSFGNTVGLCAIVNARSGLCAEDCKFCAQSVRYKTGAAVYPMLAKDEVLASAHRAKEMGAGQFGIVTSGGRLSADETRTVCEILRALKDERGVVPCASLGEIDGATARALKEAGLKRYHHNLECSERFFSGVCTTHGWQDRVRTISVAKEAGLEICAGGIFGLGEKWEDRIDLAMTLRDLKVDSVPLNFLMPVSGTPYQFQPLLSAEDALRIVALFRLILPGAEIRIAGGREQVLGAMQNKLFLAGANGLMIGDYLTTKGRKPEDDLRMIRELGLEIEVT